MSRALLFCCSLILLLFNPLICSSQQNLADSLRNALNVAKDDSMRVHLMGELGWEIMYADADSAIQLGLKAYELSVEHGWEQRAAMNLRYLGSFYYAKGDVAQSITYFDAAIAKSKALDDFRGVAAATQNLGITYRETGNYEQALRCYRSALAVNESVGREVGMASNHAEIGLTHKELGNLDSALIELELAREIYRTLENRLGEARQISNIGIVYKAQGNFPKALEYYFEALRLAETMENEPLQASAFNNIGTIYMEQNDYGNARTYLMKSINLNNELGRVGEASVALGNMGIISSNQDDFVQAMNYFQQALDIERERENLDGIARNTGNIANVYLRKAQLADDPEERSTLYLKAAEDYENAYAISQSLGNARYEAFDMAHLGSIYSEMGMYPKAKEYLTQALSKAQQGDYLVEQRYAHGYLADLYASTSTFDLAYFHYQKFIELRDSITNEQNLKELNRIEFQYDYDKKEALLLAEQDKMNAISAEEIRRKKIQRNAFSGGFALTLVLAIVFFAQRLRIAREKQRSDNLLLNILPEETAEELKTNGKSDARRFDQVTVLFTDFKGFTRMSELLSPEDLVKDLHTYFSAFDEICETHGIEKIKTIGDAYMAVGGLPTPNSTHAHDVVQAALAMAAFVANDTAQKKLSGTPFFEVRIGIHTGSVVAGIVGIKKFQYDIWGDTVNTASRMESSGEVGKVNISESTYALVKNEFNCEYRGEIEAKGKGLLKMYFVG